MLSGADIAAVSITAYGAWILKVNVDAPTDYLQDRPPPWHIAGADHAFRAVDVAR
jgi:hypothetical protein